MERLLTIWLLVFWASASCSAGYTPTKYDQDIRAAAGRYMPGVPWQKLKAQYWQESRLRPDVTSPVGAAGIAQIMPGTWKLYAGKIGEAAASPYEARRAIRVGAYIMGRLRREWTAERPENDRHSLALASYNAGIGHLLTAQKLCGGAALYDDIIACLPQVTGRHSKETIDYVDLIMWKWFPMIMKEG